METFAAAQEGGLLWIAIASGGGPVGFALVMEIKGYAHLEEIDVLPSYGGNGIGSALLGTVCSWAKKQGLRTDIRVTMVYEIDY